MAVALRSVLVKTFERLVLYHLRSITDPHVDLLFTYRASRSVGDAVNMEPMQVTFLSTALNTIIPPLLQDKLPS